MKRISWKYSFLLGASMLAGASLSAYVVSIRPEGNMPIWDQSQYPVEIRMWEGFTDGLDYVVDGSQPRLVIAEALERWTRVSSIVLNLGEDTAIQDVGLGDNTNVITAADTPINRSVVGAALGVSLRRSIGDQIVGADIAILGYPFNRTRPGPQFSRGASQEGAPGSVGARALAAAWTALPGAAWWR